MNANRFQTRLVIYSALVVTAIYLVASTAGYIRVKRMVTAGAVTDARRDLDRNTELLRVMAREGVDAARVREIAVAPWSDGSGGSYTIVDRVVEPTAADGDSVTLTATVNIPGNPFVVAQRVSTAELLGPVRHTYNFLIALTLVVIVAMAVAIGYVIRRVSRPAIERQARIDTELALARRLQLSMLPAAAAPDDAVVEIGGYMSPAREVGGDIYYHLSAAGRLHFMIADVSGKGVAAGMFMAKAVALYEELAREGLCPGEIVGRLNSALAQGNEAAMFVTAIVGRMSLHGDGEIELCNAGHTLPLAIGADGDGRYLDMPPNLPMGVMAPFDYAGMATRLAQGESLLLYTDGVTEAEDCRLGQFGSARLLEVATASAGLSAQEMVDTVAAAVVDHSRGREQTDDITLLCLRRRRGFRLTATADRRGLKELLQCGRRAEVPDRAMLAIEEAAANVVAHSGATTMTVEYLADGNCAVATVTDDGAPFDPTAYMPEEPRPAAAGCLAVGGQGIRLIRSLTSDMTYARAGDNNKLILTIKTQ